MHDLGELKGVIPVASSCERDAVRVTLVSLELYETGILLHLHLRLEGEREFPVGKFRGPRGPEPAISISDRVGEYSWSNYMMAGGSRKEWRFSYVVTPPLRPSARWLRVNVDEITMILVAPNGGEYQERWRGPWEFKVPLPIDASGTAPASRS